MHINDHKYELWIHCRNVNIHLIKIKNVSFKNYIQNINKLKFITDEIY